MGNGSIGKRPQGISSLAGSEHVCTTERYNRTANQTKELTPSVHQLLNYSLSVINNSISKVSVNVGFVLLDDFKCFTCCLFNIFIDRKNVK